MASREEAPRLAQGPASNIRWLLLSPVPALESRRLQRADRGGETWTHGRGYSCSPETDTHIRADTHTCTCVHDRHTHVRRLARAHTHTHSAMTHRRVGPREAAAPGVPWSRAGHEAQAMEEAWPSGPDGHPAGAEVHRAGAGTVHTHVTSSPLERPRSAFPPDCPPSPVGISQPPARPPPPGSRSWPASSLPPRGCSAPHPQHTHPRPRPPGRAHLESRCLQLRILSAFRARGARRPSQPVLFPPPPQAQHLHTVGT